jgi:hypothetical protein
MRTRILQAHAPQNSGFNMFIQGFSLLFTLAAVVVPIVIGFVILNQVSELSNQYIVYTGVRTRSSDHPNLYPVASPENDLYARSYGCMMDADIGRGIGQCKTQDTIKDYKTCIRALPNNVPCDQYISTNVDFLRCIQMNFNISVWKSSVFLECLDLSEPATYQSIQNLDSDVFLGSYNYAVLLLDGLTVMASFLVVTSGGWFHTGQFYRDKGKDNHIYGMWSPFSIWRIYVAWIWNIAALFAAIFISYANFGNSANLEDESKRFPVTLWTCALSIGVFGVSVAFYSSYVIEWLWAGEFAFFYSSGAQQASQRDTEQSSAQSMYESNKRKHSSHSTLTRRIFPVGHWNRGSYMGVQLYDEAFEISDEMVNTGHIMPLMLQSFAWVWLITDGLFFVGFLTPQTSITNEAVVIVFSSISIARLLQLGVAYLTNKAFIFNSAKPTDEPRVGVILAAITAQVASLMCVGTATIYYLSTLMISKNAADASSNSVSGYGIQLSFLIIVVVLPEVWRTFNLVIMTSNVAYIKDSGDGSETTGESVNGWMLFSYELLFLWEWMVRLILSLVAIMSLPTLARDQNVILFDFLATPVL